MHASFSSDVGLNLGPGAATSVALNALERKHMAHAVDTPPPAPLEVVTETYRLVILDRGGTEVLVVSDGGRFVLPSVAIPSWQRVVENLTAAVKTEWGEEVICLYTSDTVLALENGQQVGYQVTEHWRAIGASRKPTRWESVETLAQDSFADPADYSAIVQSVTKCKAETRKSTSPFARLGWFGDLRDWVESVIEPCGWHINENFQQLNASPSFSLVRFETDGPAVWFKAVGEPNQKEFAITCTLAELFPNYLPPMLSARPDWNAWLAREVVGTNLYQTEEVALWEQATAALAKLQIESIGNTARIFAAGARDQRANALSDQVQPFIEVMALLMEQQPKAPPQILNKEQLQLLGGRICDALGEFENLEIPDTLGHLDLNPGNLIVSPHQCAFLDWAEAFVGNPLFSFQYLLEHFRRVKSVSSAAETRLSKSYCKPWAEAVPSAALAEALSLSPLLAVFAYATGTDAWADEKRSQEPLTAGYLRSLTRRMHCEANQLKQRSIFAAASDPACSGE